MTKISFLIAMLASCDRIQWNIYTVYVVSYPKMLMSILYKAALITHRNVQFIKTSKDSVIHPIRDFIFEQIGYL